jgi:hypothetical protein
MADSFSGDIGTWTTVQLDGLAGMAFITSFMGLGTGRLVKDSDIRGYFG